jgi:peptide-methionine (R)-S-oxide reductase
MKMKLLIPVLLLAMNGCAQDRTDSTTKNKTTMTTEMKPVADGKIVPFNELSEAEKKVIISKGTEYPFTGQYVDHHETGVYVCRRCNSPLYRSQDKFDSHCGWPSFDDEIKGAVRRVPDADGRRVEIICNNCGAHLGHVFEGEGYTKKNTRHCVNSVSLQFIPAKEEKK